MELFHYIIRVSKKDSAFVYFILESLEGACFYSTLPEEDVHQLFRDINIHGTLAYEKELLDHLTQLQKIFPIHFLPTP